MNNLATRLFLSAMENRSKRMWVRLTPKEFEQFKQKASCHQSVSSMVRDAVQCFNPIETKGKITVIKDASETIRDATQELNRIGNNINQMAHVLNYLMLQGNREVSAAFYIQRSEEIVAVFSEAMGKIDTIRQAERQIFMQLL